jgi:hypothetical protein
MVHFDQGVARVSVGGDTLVFDMLRLASSLSADSTLSPQDLPAQRLRLNSASGERRAMLALQSLNGQWSADTLRIQWWQGTLFLGRENAVAK